METQVVYNSDLHFEHRLWKNELLFWKDEIKSFQNKFIIHNNKIEEFLDKIDAHELNIAKHYEIHQNVIDLPDLKSHNEFRLKMESERGIYDQLKKEFFKFLSRYM